MNTQFVHNLLGSTKIMKNVRQVTKDNNPKRAAVWTLEEFYVALCEWGYEKYDTKPHQSLEQSPRQAYDEGMAKYGARSHRLIPYDDNFIMSTMPTTPKEKATINQTRGIKINGIYYWNDVFLDDPQLANQQVEVRYDPYNRGVAYAHVNDEWNKCLSDHFEEFDGRTEKEIQIRSAELKRSRYLHDQGFAESAEALAADIRINEEKEAVMKQQQRDEEQRRSQKRRHSEKTESTGSLGKEAAVTTKRPHSKSRHGANDPQLNIRYGRF